MSALIDGRPAGLDAFFRPGKTFTYDLDWTAGELTGRSWTATLDAATLDVDVVGDTMTITATAAQTTTAGVGAHDFTLTETTGGGTEAVIVGTWSGSMQARQSASGSVTVAASAATVSVTVAAALASPEVVHDWTVDGWAPFVEQLVSNDGGGTRAAEQTLSVVAGRGRVTGHAGTGDGSLRVAYEREGTDWENSEVLALWWGGSVFDSGTSGATPQLGQFHRAYVGADGRWRAIVVTNNIFASDVNVVNQNVWNHEPTNPVDDELELGSNGGSKTYSDATLIRQLSIRAVNRLNFFGWLNQYSVTPQHLYGLAVGTPVTIDSQDATFDYATATAVAGVDTGSGTVSMTEVDTLSAVSVKFDSGLIVPSSASARRYWPYWVRSQLVGTRLRVKVWRYLDAEPDWSSTDHVVTQDFSLTGVTPPVAGTPEPNARMPQGVGRCGLIGAHLRNSAYLEYGHFEARRL